MLKPIELYQKIFDIDKRYLSGREITRLLNIKEPSRRVALYRLVKNGILRRLRRDVYEVVLKPSDIAEVANSIYIPSYLSFTYCLGKLGIYNQIAYEIEFATTNKTRRFEIRNRGIVFRKIKKSLFFGYTLKDNIFIAESEKALLDTLYLRSKGLASLNEEELNLGDLSRSKFLKMSKKFPPNVQKDAKRLAKRMKR